MGKLHHKIFLLACLSLLPCPAYTQSSGEPVGGYIGDLKRSQGEHWMRWPTSRIPIKVYVQPGSKAAEYTSPFEVAIAEAMEKWSSASAGLVKFVRVKSAESANLRIEWHKAGDPPLSHRAAVGETVTGHDREGIARAVIRFNTVNKMGKPVDLDVAKNASLHEFGHALGFLGHSNDKKDVMSEAVGHPPVTTPTENDAATIRAIYNSKTPMTAWVLKELLADPKYIASEKFELGTAALKGNNYPKAVELYNQALYADPKDAAAKHNLAITYATWANDLQEKRNYKDALPLFRKALPLALEWRGPKDIFTTHIQESITECMKLSGQSK